MGSESSVPIDDDVPPTTLKARTVEAVAEYIKVKNVRKIVIMVGPISRLEDGSLTLAQVGAGISTSAGIPDFRSPDTGLYANLARLDLPHPEAVFDIAFFRRNPVPFYTLAHELYPGKFRPTVAHSFINLIHRKGKLLKLFTQNIDCLEREAGLPSDMIIEAHGSFATQRCIECRTEFPDDLMRKAVEAMEVPLCTRPSCQGLVKPDIVFFGEALPESFHRNRGLPAIADLAIVMGTSLSVQPFASLPSFVSEETPRVLINLERVGGLGSRPDDVLVLGDCDAGVRKLADALGWRDELEEMWANTRKEDAVPPAASAEGRTKPTTVEDEIDKLTRDIDQSLKLSENHVQNTKEQLEKERQRDTPADDTATALPQSNGSEKEILQVPVKPHEGNGSIEHVFGHMKSRPPEKSSL